MKTIVIEDELNNLNLLSHFLKKYCPEVDLIASCQTKDEGVKLVNQLNPDLLFLDIVLEENTAFQLLEEIRSFGCGSACPRYSAGQPLQIE